jgi:hypothetical protein
MRRGARWWGACAACVMAVGLLTPLLRAQDIGAPISDLTRGQAEVLWKSYALPDVGLPSLAPVWPARVERDGARAVVVDLELPILKPTGKNLGRIGALREATVDPLELDDGETLRRWVGDERAAVRFEGENAFVMDVAPEEAGRAVPRGRRHDAVKAFRVMTLTPQADSDEAAEFEAQRTWFSLFMPLGENDAVLGAPVPKGVVLLMPGLFATPEGTLERLTTRMRKSGFAVLRMWAQPSRFTQRLEFDISPQDGLADDAAAIASAMDDRTAECAFAAREAFAHVGRARPELAALPRGVVGFSGGAMTLPSVVALEPEKYAAAVMVGGGCCFWQMNETSNYRSMIDAVRVRWPEGTRTDASVAELRRVVLEKSTLDSFHTAAALRGSGASVLVVQAILDEAVPSPLGDVLWKRLGRPRRLLLEAGHEPLFMQVPQHFGKMVEVIEEGVARAAERGKPE